MSKRLVLILFVLLGIVVSLEILLPVTAGHMLTQGMAGALGSEDVDVNVTSRPAVLMLGGHFDKIAARAKNVKTDKITISDMTAELSSAQLDMAMLASHHSVALRAVQDIQLTAVVTQDDLARYLNQSVKGIKNATVVISPEKVQASSNFSLGLATLSVELEGNIVSDGQKVKFVTQRFMVNNNLLGRIGGNALTEIPLFDVSRLPFQAKIRDIILEDGRIVIKAGT